MYCLTFSKKETFSFFRKHLCYPKNRRRIMESKNKVLMGIIVAVVITISLYLLIFANLTKH